MWDRGIELMHLPWDILEDIYGIGWPVRDDKVALVTAIIDVEFPAYTGKRQRD
jgi:hypothetical protein